MLSSLLSSLSVSLPPSHRPSDPRNRKSYINFLGALTQQLAPDIVWVMCGHVTLIANETVHTGNGCPHNQALPAWVTPGAAGDPAMYTEVGREEDQSTTCDRIIRMSSSQHEQ